MRIGSVFCFIIIYLYQSFTPAAVEAASPWDGGSFTKPACNIFEPPPNCKGIYATQVEVGIPGTGISVGGAWPVCGPSVEQEKNAYLDGITRAAVAFYGGDKEELYRAAGDLANKGFSDFIKQNDKKFGGDGWQALKRNFAPKTNQAQCRMLSAVIPQKAKIVGYRFVRVFGNNYRTCSKSHVSPSANPTGDCDWSRFEYEPRETTENGVRIVYTVYASWSCCDQMNGRMIVFYRSPEPPSVFAGM